MRKQIRYREWEEEPSNWVNYVDHNGEYMDEVSGEYLDAEMVHEARKDEMREIEKHNVYTKVPIEECWKETGKNPIGTK